MGDNDELVAAGSDLGHVFIYNSATGEVRGSFAVWPVQYQSSCAPATSDLS